MKRKSASQTPSVHSPQTPSKRQRIQPYPPPHNDHPTTSTPRRSSRRTARVSPNATESGVTTSKTPPKRPALSFSTPSKANGTSKSAHAARDAATPNAADRSARRKSKRRLQRQTDADDSYSGGRGDDDPLNEEEDALARRILRAQQSSRSPSSTSVSASSPSSPTLDPTPTKPHPALKDSEETPTRRRRGGRPQGWRKPRTPTPPRDMPPHEHYFFQTRPRGSKTSDNTLSGVSLLSAEEYHEAMRRFRDPHEREIQFLRELHEESFGRWREELEAGFGVLLYGWGSKRGLVQGFAEFLAKDGGGEGGIVVVDGYTSGLSVREIITTVASALPSLPGFKVPVNPADAVAALLSALDDDPPNHDNDEDDEDDDPEPPKTILLINSLDAVPLRRPGTQAHLARLASHPRIALLATADTPHFPLLWDLRLRTAFNFVSHDATTFAPLDTELGGAAGVVDTVTSLLSRRGSAAHKPTTRGAALFVLRSLNESARRLYSLLLTEILSSCPSDAAEDDDGFETALRGGAEMPGVSGKALYRKAVQELVVSSESGFRGLLREFVDHEMILVGGRGGDGVDPDAGLGREVLSVPFGREECEGLVVELMDAT